MIIHRDIEADISERIRPLMRAFRNFAEGVTPVTTWWGKPITTAQLRDDPFKDPATASRMGLSRPIPTSWFPPSMRR